MAIEKLLNSSLAIGAMAAAVTLGACSKQEPAPAPPTPAAAVEPLPTPAPAPVAVKKTEMQQEGVTANVADLVKPLLQPGTDLGVAASGFRTHQDFVAAAHAAKNLDIPFLVLKDKTVNKKMTLSAAIKSLKPSVNASAEASRATAEARADLARG